MAERQSLGSEGEAGRGASPSAIVEAAQSQFVVLFNRGRYFEAHEVLEGVWLPARGKPEADFHRGLIQLAAAFVHAQQRRGKPALALIDRAVVHLGKYASVYQGLSVDGLLERVAVWRRRLAALADGEARDWACGDWPRIEWPGRG